MRGDVVSQSGERLKSGQLGTADVTASTVANIGPGIDFYFGFGVVAATAGVAAPLTILAAALAVALLAFTVAEFTKAEPSAGSFITYDPLPVHLTASLVGPFSVVLTAGAI
jgi:amino acid transporter